MRRTTAIRSVAFGVIVAGGLALGTAPANARTEARRAPVTDTAEECHDYCIIGLGTTHYSWDPRTGACHCW
ncbi:MAG TPA: hypothetical protein VFJ16_09440 [Longimicrobium sp.]|nr:hypothetical protein [Longimicrobium sp.]